MRRLLQSFVVLSGTTVIAAAGCADNDSSLFIQGVLASEPPDCDVTADPGQPMLGSGVLDLAFSFEYQAWLLVGNNLAPRGRKNQLRTETARVRLNGAIVSLSDDLGNELIEFSLPGSGFVNVTTGENASYGALQATLIPQPVGSDLFNQLSAEGGRALLVANVRAFGETLGGQELESADFSFPIEVCYGCSVVFPPESILQQDGPAECGATAANAGELSCFPGQGSIDCRWCAGSLDVCRCAGGLDPATGACR